LVYRENNRVIRNEKRPFVENLDEFPYPAWDLVNLKGYRLPITNRPFLLVLTGRGCPYPCTFCAAGVFYGKKPRLRSPKSIASEIKYIREKYGINDFLFWSENSISDRQHIYDLSKEISRQAPGVKWVCNGRVDMIDEELLREMKKAGCWMIGYGVEAGTQRVLDLMKKNTKLSDIERAVRLTKNSGIEVTGHVIVGYPGETREDILKTKDFLKKLDLDYIQVYCSVPFPGSSLYEETINKGWVSSSDWSIFEQNFSVINTPQLSANEVMELRKDMVKSFYLDPRKILKTLLKIKSPREILFFISFAKDYFTSWVRAK
ncbi:MAG: radical SAM protein, partial [Candidatus Omnitrophica bacterium]|nr:radical SAM protein [Candidatus Omnitrophota bacterium]